MVAHEARSWCGTKFVWGQSRKGVGCDCKGLVLGVARELGFPEAETFQMGFSAYRPDKPVPVDFLKDGLAALLDPVSEPMPGDVLLLMCGGSPSHLAIVTFDGRAVHAQIGTKDWVKETRLAALLKINPLVSIWRWRDNQCQSLS